MSVPGKIGYGSEAEGVRLMPHLTSNLINQGLHGAGRLACVLHRGRHLGRSRPEKRLEKKNKNKNKSKQQSKEKGISFYYEIPHSL